MTDAANFGILCQYAKLGIEGLQPGQVALKIALPPSFDDDMEAKFLAWCDLMDYEVLSLERGDGGYGIIRKR